GREEPAQVGQLLRFPRSLCRAAGEAVEAARRAADAARWESRDERAARFGAGPVEDARPRGRVRRGTARWRIVGRASGGVLAGYGGSGAQGHRDGVGAAAGTFFDLAVVHLLTTATI